MRSLTHLDLFTGIGGFHIAAQWAGFETVGFSEIEPYCCRLLTEKWPDIINYADLRNADFTELGGSVTVLSAGVPCQPASLAGKRRGAADDRWLWPATLDVIGSVQPTWCIFENPPGILSLDEFEGILLRLESLGYQVRAFSVPANAVGAKHRRQRVFIVANRSCELEVRQQQNRPIQSSAIGQGGVESLRGSKALADADATGLEEHKPRQPGQFTALVGSGWINGTGQFESGIRRGFDGLSDWPHPLTTERIPNRSHRLKALGNAVVPQQAYPFFEAIAKVERGENK